MKIILLSGGKSSRMGTDKMQLLRADGRTVFENLHAILSELGSEIYLSVRDESQPALAGLPTLVDVIMNAGPLGALHAAWEQFDESILLVAGDLALLNRETLRQLIDQHQQSARATCFANRLDQKSEPLCAIYEPKCKNDLLNFLNEKQFCARSFLEKISPTVLALHHPCSLDNCNTPEDWSEIQEKLRSGIRSCQVKIHYHALLREARGVSQETYQTYAHTALGLYEELRFTYRLPLRMEQLRLAKNQEFVSWQVGVNQDDEFTFLQPFSGG